MGNVYMEAEQVRFKNSTYHNLQTAVSAALEGGGGGGTTVVANPEGSATDDLSKLQVGTTIYGIPADAGDISYDNTSSGMTADDVQDAIDELKASIPGVATTSAPGIVQPDGTTITISDGVISAAGGSGEIYSDVETAVGTWLGQTLYRKVIDCGQLPNNGYTKTATGLDSAAQIVQIRGISRNVNNETMCLPFASDTAQYNIPIKYTGNLGADAFKIEIYSAANYSAYTDTKVVIDYIKTV